MRELRIGTRGSQLALWQANDVAARLRRIGMSCEIVPIQTTGDRHLEISLAALGGKGLFIKELEEALDKGEIDLAVHSLKDVPSMIPERFKLAGFLEREDPRDVWIHRDSEMAGDVTAGARIGTSSPRRRAQLKRLLPWFRCVDMRGNIGSRIRKLREGRYEAIILAAAGLLRLGLEHEITTPFSTTEMVPAAGQGIIVIETRTDDADIISMASRLTHEPTERAAAIERGVLQKFGTLLDCHSAVAVHAEVRKDGVHVDAFISDTKGDEAIRIERSFTTDEAGDAAARVAAVLFERGAVALVERRATE